MQSYDVKRVGCVTVYAVYCGRLRFPWKCTLVNPSSAMEWSQHRLMATVLRILEDAGRIKGVTARVVVEELRRVYHDLFLEFKVKFALKESVDAGLVEHCAGKYRLIVPLRGRSKSAENVVVIDTNVKEIGVEETSVEEPKPKPIAAVPEVQIVKEVGRKIRVWRHPSVFPQKTPSRREKKPHPRKKRASLLMALRSLQRPLALHRPRSRSAHRFQEHCRCHMVLRRRNAIGRALSTPRSPRPRLPANPKRRRRRSAGASKTRRGSQTRKRP